MTACSRLFFRRHYYVSPLCLPLLACFLLSSVAAFTPKSAAISRPTPQATTTNQKLSAKNDDTGDSDSSKFNMAELSRRIETLRTEENVLGTKEESVYLPVVSFDALLPNQRLSGRTTDETFGRMLGKLGLGGLFVMTSLNHSKRKLRRNGVICRIELVDAPTTTKTNRRIPTAVAFQVVGLRRCRLIGQAKQLKARVGRWRRSYDPDGEEIVLGFGDEWFLDAEETAASTSNEKNGTTTATTATTVSSSSSSPPPPPQLGTFEWSSQWVDCALVDKDCDDEVVLEKAASIVPLIEQWQSLARNIKTYENTDVVVASRILRGHPGLRVDPDALLRNVCKDLGEQPSKDPGVPGRVHTALPDS